MAEDFKTWMIESGDVLDVMPPLAKQPDVARLQPTGPVGQRAQAKPSQIQATKRPVAPAVPEKSGLQFAHLAILTYLLGPLSILLTPRGRRQKKMVATGLLSVGSMLVLASLQFAGVVDPNHPLSVWGWLALLVVAVVGGFTVWARALHFVGREGIPHASKFPSWVTRSWVISGLGFVAPGSGFLLGGRADRAAIVLWLMWPIVAAVVILTNTLGLWQHHQTSGWLASSGLALEKVFIVAGAVVALGFLGYLAQALEGMREVLVTPKMKAEARTNYYALGALALVVVLVVVASPVQMARQFGLGGDILRAEGFQTIPLRLSLVASRLDPANATYAMQAMELYDEMGDTEQAAVMRSQMDQNLGSYVALVQKETVAEFGQRKPRPVAADPHTLLDTQILQGTMARPSEGVPAVEDVPLRKRVTQALGLPYGLGWSKVTEEDGPAVEKPGPGK